MMSRNGPLKAKARQWIDAVFSPRGVAVVGSSRNPSKLAWGTLQAVLRKTSQEHSVVAVDRHAHSTPTTYTQVAHPSEVPTGLASNIDLAVLVTGRDSTLDAMQDCIQHFPSLKAINVVSGGFRETTLGDLLEQKMVRLARNAGIRLIGPNSVGTIDAFTGFSSMFLRTFPRPGGLSFISQSGGVCGAAVELLSTQQQQGFSKLLSLGNAADVGFVESLSALGEDLHTQVVMLYMEGLCPCDEGAEFVDVTRHLSLDKPIIALKAGTSSAGSRAVSSHTGTMAGDENVYDAALRRAGIVQAPNLRTMLDMAQALSCRNRVFLGADVQSLPLQNKYNVAVITNAGGPSALMVDALVSSEAASVPPLPGTTQQAIRHGKDVHALTSTGNPVDLLGGATNEAYASTLKAALETPGIDAAVCMSVPMFLTKPKELAEQLVAVSKKTPKPLLALMVSRDQEFLDPAVLTLYECSIPIFRHADGVVAAFRAWKQREDRFPRTCHDDKDAVERLSDAQVTQGRALLESFSDHKWVLEYEAKRLLDIVGIEQPRGKVVECLSDSSWGEDVIAAAEAIGYPVVLKRMVRVHKSDSGDVAVNLRDSSQVRNALVKMRKDHESTPLGPMLVSDFISEETGLYDVREFIVGFTRDKTFGPVICFGSGGILVEALKDYAFALPPESRQDTLDLLSRPRLASLRISGDLRGEPPLDQNAIATVIERCAAIARAFPNVAEFDINPLMVGTSKTGQTRVVAADIKFRLE